MCICAAQFYILSSNLDFNKFIQEKRAEANITGVTEINIQVKRAETNSTGVSEINIQVKLAEPNSTEVSEIKNHVGYWRHFSYSIPSVYDAFSRHSVLYVIFQSKNGHCGRCVRHHDSIWLDFNGIGKEITWYCELGSMQITTQVSYDPHGHCFVVQCPIPLHAPNIVNITARAFQEESLVYTGVGYDKLDDNENQLELAACTMVNPAITRAQHIIEWVAYHRLHGFKHFKIYSDGNPASLEIALSPYIREGLVEVVDWTWPNQGFHHQQTQMHSCLYRYRSIARWVAFFDMDEFFQPMGHNTILGVLETKGGNWAGVTARMVNFAPNGRDLMTQMSHQRTAGALEAGTRSKCIIRPDQVDNIGVHEITRGGASYIADPVHELRLNHYRSGLDAPTIVVDDSMTKYGPGLLAEMERVKNSLDRDDMGLEVHT
jgi:hypothetical protein